MSPPVFRIVPRAGLANRMLQYLVALNFQRQVPGSRIADVVLPEWGILHAPLASTGPVETASEDRLVDIDGLAARARAGLVGRIEYTAAGTWMKNLPVAGVCSDVFRTPSQVKLPFDERHMLCPLGVGDPFVGQGFHFPLTPVEFYADIVAETGLVPVFLGHTGSNSYTNRLRARFPNAVFMPPTDARQDFAAIRQAKNIVLGVTTLAWLAAWLSDAERIFMPVSGLFNPMQFHYANLLPFGDPRYRFYLFPINHGVPLEHHAALHRRIAPYWRLMSHAVLHRQLQQAPRFDPPMVDMLATLDAKYYLRENPDVAEKTGIGNAAQAREHFRWPGSFERRLPFALSEPWYAAEYPLAAVAVAQGDYSSFAQHYVAFGRARGYRKLPDPAERPTWWDIAQDQPIQFAAPSITVLAAEWVKLETASLLEQEGEVSLGGGFAKLPPELATLFTRRHATEPVSLYRLRDVVLDASTMTLFCGGEPIPETQYMATQRDYERALTMPVSLKPTDPQCHYIIGGNRAAGSYYHWMTQSLPAIDWGLRQRQHGNVALALPALQPWQEDTLALLGHAEVARLTLDPAAHYMLASADYAEFLGGRLAGIVSRAAGATYARLRQSVAPAGDGSDVIYVARTDSPRRVARNEAALIAMLERQGVRIVVPGSQPVAQQIATFRAARLVIGMHGAGLSNIMGCEPGAHLYELLPSHYANFCYNRLAQTCRLHYWADVFPGTAGKSGPHDKPWRIDLDVVAARLDAIRARMAVTEQAANGR